MRNAVLVLLALVVAAPAAAALQKRDAGDGTITIEAGNGAVIVQARGAVIGRLESGTLEIVDLSPDDANEPVVVGKGKERLKGGARTWRGQKLSFRLIGGSYRLVVRGTGIDLSAVGRGFVQLRGELGAASGLFSVTGDDCGLAPERCQPLPDRWTRIELGDRERKNAASLVLAP